MARDPQVFRTSLARKLAQAARRKARPSVRSASKSLALGMKVRLVPVEDPTSAKAVVHIPHYWAVYVHDGRGPFRKGTFMVWWKDPKRDPRLKGGRTPERASQLRRLTRAQWLAAVAERDAWIRSGGDPTDSPVIITKAIRKRTKPSRFFGNEPGEGMSGFGREASQIVQKEFSQHVRQVLGDNFRRAEIIRGRV